jgi:hypothetical protein
MESIYHIIVDKTKTRRQIDVTTPVECRQNTYASFLITAAFTGMIHLLALRAMLFLLPRDDCRGERVAVPVEIVRALTTELSPPLSCRTSAALGCVVWVRRVLFGTGDSWTVACGASVSATTTCVVRKQIPSTLASYLVCPLRTSW